MARKSNKDKTRMGIFVAILLAAVFFFAQSGGMFASITGAPVSTQSAEVSAALSGACVGLAATPTVTLNSNDKYNLGTAVTTKNMYRILGTNTWKNVAGAATFSVAGGTQIELVTGIDTTDDDEEPHGALISKVTVPCAETPTIDFLVANDATAAELTGVYYDQFSRPNTAETGVSAGDMLNLGFSETGTYEKDFGNAFCGALSNRVTVKYNSTMVDDVLGLTASITPAAGSELFSGTTTVSLKEVASNPLTTATYSATGYTLKTFEFPVLESNTKVVVNYVIDVDDTIALNTSISGVNIYVTDSAQYLDTDDNKVYCGVADEDDVQVGATAYDVITPLVGQT